jgi:hypothetical protein
MVDHPISDEAELESLLDGARVAGLLIREREELRLCRC